MPVTQDGTSDESTGAVGLPVQKVILTATCMIRSPAVAVGRPNNVPRVSVVPTTL